MTGMTFYSARPVILKSILALIIVSMVFAGGSRAEAASVTWTHGTPTQTCDQIIYVDAATGDACSYTGCAPGYWATLMQGGTDGAYAGVPYTVPAGYQIYLNWWGGATPAALAFRSGKPISYFIAPQPYSSSYGPYQACDPTPYLTVDSTFSAVTDKDTYAPGSPVSVSLAACSGDCATSGNRGVWQGGYTPINVVNKIFTSIFGGGGGPPAVGVGADFNGVTSTSGQSFNGGQFNYCDGPGSSSCARSFYAPKTPGSYTISLDGCFNGGTQVVNCTASSVPFTVACPAGQTLSANGKSCAAPASCTYSGTLSWGAGCSANVNTTTPSGTVYTVTNVAPGYTGSEQYSCTNGSWAGPTNASCTVSSTVTWTNYCTGGNDVNGNNWQIWAYSNQTPTGYKYVGPGTAANGCAAPVNPGACTYSGTLSWGVGCVANVNAAAPNSGAVTVTNTAPGYTGSEQYSCSNGVWAGPTNTSCAPFTPVNIVQSPGPTQPSQTSQQPSSNQPPVQTCAANAGASCPSSPNFCGQTTIGTYSCTDVCSAVTPSDSLCPPPTVSISASSLRVQSGKSSTISWSSTYAKSCTVTKNGVAWAGSLNSSGTLDPRITTQSVYKLSCTGPGGSASAQATVNVVPTYQEF